MQYIVKYKIKFKKLECNTAALNITSTNAM